MNRNSSGSAITRAITRFDDRLRLARASELALAGRFIEAEALIMTDCHRPSHEGYDLLARIQVRQGRLQQAQGTWEKSLETGGCKKNIEPCLVTLADHQENVLKRRILFWKLNLFLWAIITCLAIWIYLNLL